MTLKEERAIDTDWRKLKVRPEKRESWWELGCGNFDAEIGSSAFLQVLAEENFRGRAYRGLRSPDGPSKGASGLHALMQHCSPSSKVSEGEEPYGRT